MTGTKKNRDVFIELALAWLVVIGGTRLANLFSGVPFIADNLALITATLLLYTPLWIHFKKREKNHYFDTSFRDYQKSFFWFALVTLALFPLVLIANHFFQSFMGLSYQPATFGRIFERTAFEILVIALPEEFFFRGYMQKRLNEIWPKKWKLMGVSFGLALPVVSFIFAISHSLIQFQWWHIFIFFPSLVFGWLYEKRGTITAPLLFHAACNIFAQWVFIHYR